MATVFILHICFISCESFCFSVDRNFFVFDSFCNFSENIRLVIDQFTTMDNQVVHDADKSEFYMQFEG